MRHRHVPQIQNNLAGNWGHTVCALNHYCLAHFGLENWPTWQHINGHCSCTAQMGVFGIKLDNKAWRPWGIPTQECVKCSLK